MTNLLDRESSRIFSEFDGWRHESNRAACLGCLINPIGMYL